MAVTGYVSGRMQTEIITLNGTAKASGSVTFDAGVLFVSKSANTTGNITVTENSGSTTLIVIGKEEVSPRFKVLSCYPIPTSTTLYIELS